MKKLIVSSEFILREIDNGFVLKIRKKANRQVDAPHWEVEIYIDSIGKAGQIFNAYLYDKAAPDTGDD